MAGYRETLAVEWDNNAARIFRDNFPEVPLYHGDIAQLSDAECLEMAQVERGLLDVLDGSPPCQGFSTAGARNMEDPRNGLFREYVRLLRALMPRAFVMENVSGMVKGKMRLIFVECLKELKACGYRVSARLMNAAYFGVPQSRQRIILIGVRSDLGIEPSHPTAAARPIGLRDAIGLRRGWGMVDDGVKNKQFNNKYRSLNLPCVTLEKTRPPIVRLAGKERELTLEECAAIGSFPLGFKWGPRAYQRIGNSVPPLFMRAIAGHIRTAILESAAEVAA